VPHLQSAEAHPAGAASTIALAYGSNITAASLLLVDVSWDYSGGTFVSIADTLTSTWTQVGSELQDTANTQANRLYYAYNSGAGANTVTVTFSAGTADFRRISVAEYSGAMTASDPVDQTASVAGGDTATGTDGTATGNITPTVDGCLVAAVLTVNNGTPTVDAGTSYTERVDGITGGSAAAIELEDFTQGAAAAIPGRWTLSAAGNKFNARVVSFKPAITAADPTWTSLPRRGMAGVG